MKGLLAGEWLKLRSVRSTHYAIGAAALMVVLGVVWVYYVGTVWEARDLVGLGLGAVTRSTAGGIVSVGAVLFVVPAVANYLPDPWNTRISSVLPTSLVSQIAGDNLSTRLGDGMLRPTAAVAVLLGYAVVAVAAGMVAIRWRDV